MLTKIKQDNMPDKEKVYSTDTAKIKYKDSYGDQFSFKRKTKDKTVSADLTEGKGNVLPTFEIVSKGLKQMMVDPLTGMPLTTPGPQGEPSARSSDLYAAEDPGYPQGSMVNAMAANPMMGGLTQYGLKQKEMPKGKEGKGIRSLPASVQEKMGFDPLSQMKKNK